MLSFDCYGTLIDWETGILGALRPMLARRGLGPSDAQLLSWYAAEEARVESGPYRRYREVLRETLAGIAARAGFSPDPAETCRLADTLGDWPPFADTVEALGRLRSRYRLAVLSNVDRDLFARTAERLGHPFDLVVTAEEVGSYKPSAANFRALLAASGVAPDRLLHVAESRYHDIVPASRLGLRTVWVERHPGAAATASGAPGAVDVRPDLVVPSLAALADLC